MTVDKTINFTERGAAPDTPATGDWRLYFKSGGLYIVDDAGTETLVSGGASGANTALSNLAAVAINTSLVSDTDSTDDLGSTSVYWRNAYLDTVYFTEQAAPATPDAGKVVIYPKSDGLMYSKDDAGTETLMSGGAGSGGAYTSVAILRDEKTTGTAGGSTSAATWNNRNLNTEAYDPDSIVAISSNQFTPIAGDYEIQVAATVFNCGLNRLRLYNVTGAASVEEGLNAGATATDDTPIMTVLFCKFTANGTDAYRIDHYSQSAQATNGLGAAVSDGSAEVYLELILRKVA